MVWFKPVCTLGCLSPFFFKTLFELLKTMFTYNELYQHLNSVFISIIKFAFVNYALFNVSIFCIKCFSMLSVLTMLFFVIVIMAVIKLGASSFSLSLKASDYECHVFHFFENWCVFQCLFQMSLYQSKMFHFSFLFRLVRKCKLSYIHMYK